MSEHLCIFCKHFDWEQISEYTCGNGTCGGTEGGASCKKGHYSEERPWDVDDLRKLYLRAESCADYSRPKS